MLWSYLFIVLVARGALAFVPSMWGWGLNVQRFLDPVSAWGLWSLCLAALVPGVAAPLASALDRIGSVFCEGGRRGYAIAALAGGLLIWLLPDRVWFVGDFLQRQGNVESGFYSGNYIGSMPLDYFFHSILLRPFGFGSAEAANTAARVLGAVEAGLLAMLAVHFPRVLELKGKTAALAGSLLFFGGYLTIFTGLGKPASEMCLVTAGVGTFGIAATRGKSGLLPVGVLLALGLLVHRSGVILVPAWLISVDNYLRLNKEAPLQRHRTTVAIVLPLIMCLVTVPAVLSIAMNYDFSHHVLTQDVSRQGGLLRAAFSLRHLLDLANIVLVLSPIALGCTAIAFLRPTFARGMESRMLVALVVPVLLVLFLVNPQQGIFRDWDVFAPAGVALSLVAAYAMTRLVESGGGHAKWLAVPVVVVAASFTLQWLLLNSDADRGLTRIRHYLLESPGPKTVERQLVWDFLALRNMRLHRWTDAAYAAEQASKDAPHRRILLMWAISETMDGQYRDAELVYRRLLERSPRDPLAWLGLAGVARRLNDKATLDEALARLRSYDPNGPELRTIRRHLAFFPEVWPFPLDWIGNM